MKWKMIKLGDVITFRGGGTPRKDVPEYWSDEIPWATVKDFKGLVLERTQDFISPQGLASSASNLIPSGHVIIPTRMALGKAAINAIDLAINQDLRALIPKVPIDTVYLLHMMLGLSDEIQSYGSGATVKGITQEKLSELKIPLPPIEEQKRIAAILDAADALRVKRRESIAQLDALLQSTFLDMFGDPVTNPMGWEVVSMQSIAGESFRNGISASTTGSIQGQVLTLSAITSGTYDDKYWKYVKFNRVPQINQLVSQDAFLICRGSGNKKMVGVGVFPRSIRGSIVFPDTIIATTPDLSRIERAYLQFVWASRKVREQIESGARTTNGTYKVNQGVLNSVTFPLPPLSLQRRFASIVEAAERQKARLRAHLDELDALFASLQSRAFNGEL